MDDPLAGELITLRPGVRLQVCHQPGEGPAVVFLHGGLGNRFNLRSQYEFACAQGWQCLAYDLAGHGQSSPYRRYSIGRHGRDLARLLRRYPMSRPILVCHSYGVPLALEWVQRYPAAGLVLIAGGTHDLDPWWEVPLMLSLRWGGRHLFRWSWLQQRLGRLSSRHDHPVIRQCIAECPIPVAAEPYKALEIFWGYHFFNRQPRRWVLDLPALILSGGADPMFTYAMGKTLASHFSHGRHVHIAAGGHLLMAEYPDRVNAELQTFRKELVLPFQGHQSENSAQGA